MTDEKRVDIRPLGRPGDLGWVVMAHGETYAREFGWDSTFEGLVARIVADYATDHDPGRESAWIAELDGRRVGCVFLVSAEHSSIHDVSSDDDGPVAQLRILLVTPAARGRHLGQQLVRTAVRFATESGYRVVRLWTNHPLTAAAHVYAGEGFRLIREQPHRSFGLDLIGQIYELDLTEPELRVESDGVVSGDNA